MSAQCPKDLEFCTFALLGAMNARCSRGLSEEQWVSVVRRSAQELGALDPRHVQAPRKRRGQQGADTALAESGQGKRGRAGIPARKLIDDGYMARWRATLSPEYAHSRFSCPI